MSDRHEMQAAGTHPAPCARHCESTAYEIEIRRLRAELAASREREARMRALLETWVKAADGDGNPVMTIIDFDKLVRAALTEGAQG